MEHVWARACVYFYPLGFKQYKADYILFPHI